MKKIAFCIVFFVTAVAGAFSQKTVQLNYALGGFNEINVSSSFSVYVEKGTDQSIVVVADEHIADDVRVTVSHGVLSIYLDNGRYGKITTLKAHVVTPELKGVKLTGSSDLTSEDTFATEKFTASLAGSSDLQINIRATDTNISAMGSSDVVMNVETINLKINAAGSSDAILTGKSMNMIADCAGSSTIKASGLAVSEAKISVIGSSDMVAKVQGGQLDAYVSGSSKVILEADVPELKVSSIGASEVKLSGKAGLFKGSATGSSGINAFELVATDVILGVTGASSVKTYAEKTLNVSAVGASTVIYRGEPALTSKLLGSSTVRKQ